MPRILIVDDEPEIVRGLEDNLRFEGYRRSRPPMAPTPSRSRPARRPISSCSTWWCRWWAHWIVTVHGQGYRFAGSW